MGAGGLAQQSLTLFGEVDGVTPAIFRIGAALEEFSTFEGIEEADEIGLLDAESIAKVPLAQARVCGDEDQSSKLRRTKAEWAHDRVEALGRGGR